jgi:hypothetical protein
MQVAEERDVGGVRGDKDASHATLETIKQAISRASDAPAKQQLIKLAQTLAPQATVDAITLEESATEIARRLQGSGGPEAVRLVDLACAVRTQMATMTEKELSSLAYGSVEGYLSQQALDPLIQRLYKRQKAALLALDKAGVGQPVVLLAVEGPPGPGKQVARRRAKANEDALALLGAAAQADGSLDWDLDRRRYLQRALGAAPRLSEQVQAWVADRVACMLAEDRDLRAAGLAVTVRSATRPGHELATAGDVDSANLPGWAGRLRPRLEAGRSALPATGPRAQSTAPSSPGALAKAWAKASAQCGID